MPRMGNQNPSAVLCPLWIAETLETLSPCGHDPALHTSATALHMHFQCACGSRGKPGSAQATALPLFQNCRIAQLRFRKLRNRSTVTFADTLRSFPLFLVELRVLLSFSLILHPFITTRRALRALFNLRTPQHRVVSALLPAVRDVRNATSSYSREPYLFSTRNSSAG